MLSASSLIQERRTLIKRLGTPDNVSNERWPFDENGRTIYFSNYTYGENKIPPCPECGSMFESFDIRVLNCGIGPDTLILEQALPRQFGMFEVFAICDNHKDNLLFSLGIATYNFLNKLCCARGIFHKEQNNKQINAKFEVIDV